MKDLFALRGEASFRVGEYTPVIQDKDVLAFVRAFDGEKGYCKFSLSFKDFLLSLLNFGCETPYSLQRIFKMFNIIQMFFLFIITQLYN